MAVTTVGAAPLHSKSNCPSFKPIGFIFVWEVLVRGHRGREGSKFRVLFLPHRRIVELPHGEEEQ